jgi:hypothetical protein
MLSLVLFRIKLLDEVPEFSDALMCPVCGRRVPTVQMDVRIIAQYTCPKRGSDVVIETEKPPQG